MPSSATKPPKRLPTSVDLEQRLGHHRSFAPQALLHQSDQPFGAMITKATSSTPTISRLTADEIVTVATCWIVPSRIAPTSGPIQLAGAADHRHGDRVDRIGEPEGRRRLEIADVVGERRAGHAHQRAGDRGRDQLQPQRRHAAGFGGQFVVADGGEAEAEPRALDRARGRDRHDREQRASAGTDTGCRGPQCRACRSCSAGSRRRRASRRHNCQLMISVCSTTASASVAMAKNAPRSRSVR